MNEATLTAGVAHLTAVDAAFGAIVQRYGSPPTWRRPEGFATLVLLILEQQVSLASAAATYRTLCLELAAPLEPASFLRLDAPTLRCVGFSRQKASYCRDIAASLLEGTLRLDDLASLDDESVRRRLMAVRGIGPWTAECYLLSALGRPDVWPHGDRALQVAVGRIMGLDGPADAETMFDVAERWRPYRAVAARLLWLDYLEGSIQPGMG